MTDNRTTERIDHPPRVREAIDELMREKDATDNRTTELLCCPFCGGEVKLTTYRDEGWEIKCENHDWPNATWERPLKASDIAADVGMYSWGLGEDAKAALIAAWNARAEQTCRNDKDKWSGLAKYLFVCSECGWNLADVGNDAIDISARLMKRCPMCGAKVIV